MISEQVRSYKELEQKRDLIKLIQKVARRKGDSAKDDLVQSHTYQEGRLTVSFATYEEPAGKWHFISVVSQDREVFAAGALRTRQSRGPIDYSVTAYHAGPWEGHIRRLARPKPKGKR